MRLLLSLLAFASITLGSSLARAQRDGNFELKTSSGRKYRVVAARPETAFLRTSDPSVIVQYLGTFPHADVTLKVKDLIDLAENLGKFRTNEEMVQAGFVPRLGNVLTSRFKEKLGLALEQAKRKNGIETKKSVQKILDGMYKAPTHGSIPTEEIHEIALMVAAGNPAHGQVAFETMKEPGVEVLPQAVGWGATYIFLGQIINIRGWRPPVAGLCARMLQANNPRKVIYVPFLLARIVLASAAVADATGRIIDLTDGLDPGYSPLLSYLIFGDMEPEGDALRASAAAFQNKYQQK